MWRHLTEVKDSDARPGCVTPLGLLGKEHERVFPVALCLLVLFLELV